MNFNCATNDYDRIYAPWLEEPGKLLDLADYRPDDILLDLGGGSGAVSKEAVRRTDLPARTKAPHYYPHWNLLDPNPRAHMPGIIHEVAGHAEQASKFFHADMFDVVVCRQAIGYMDVIAVIQCLHHVLKVGGRFVFNSFAKPSRFGFRFRSVKQIPRLGFAFDAQTIRFLEAHVFLFGRVFHLQVRLNHGPAWDVSCFKFHDPAFLHGALEPWFKVEMRKNGQSIHWLCRKEAR